MDCNNSKNLSLKTISPSEESVEDLLAKLSIQGDISTPTGKEAFDTFHRALDLRRQALERHHARVRGKLRSTAKRTRVDQKRMVLEPEALQDWKMFQAAKACVDIPIIVVNMLRSTVSMHTEVVKNTSMCVADMIKLASSDEFRLKAVTLASLTGLRWGLQPPRLITLLIDVIQYFVAVCADFIVVAKDSVLTAAQSILDLVSPSAPAQPLQGDALVMEPEALDTSQVTALLVGTVSVLASSMAGFKILATPDLMKGVKQFGDLGRATNGIKALAENSIALFSWIFESVQMLLTNQQGRTHLVDDPQCVSLGITPKFMEDVEDLIDPAQLNDHMRQGEFRDKLNVARAKLIQMSGKRGLTSSPHLRNYLNARVSALTKVLSENMNKFAGKGGEARIPPFCVQFYGLPGSGKSNVMKQVAKAITTEDACGRVLPNTQICSQMGVSKNWDSFQGEGVMLIDDAFMTRGSTPGESEYTRFITLISCVSMTVPKADLASKGLTADSVRLVIVSSNVEHPSASEINNSDALLRRRHVVWNTVLKDESDKTVDSINDFSRFVLRDSLSKTGVNLSRRLTYCEMLRHTAKMFKEHLDREESIAVPSHELPVNFFDEAVELTKQSLDDYTYRPPRPTLAVHDLCPFTDEKLSGIVVPIYEIEPHKKTVSMHLYANETVCCSPVPIYSDNFDDNVRACNHTRIISHLEREFPALNTTVCDVGYGDLTDKHCEMFGEAIENGFTLPQRNVVEQVVKLLPHDTSDEEVAWEAVRIQERAFRRANVNVKRQCAMARHESWADDTDFDLNGMSYEYLWEKDNDYDTEYEPEAWFGWTREELWERRIEVCLKVVGVVVGVVAGVKLLSVVKNYFQSAHVLIPSIKYDAQSLDDFVKSAPSAYQGRLAEAVCDVAMEIEEERRIAIKALQSDDSTNLRMTSEGLVYDGTPNNVRRMALVVQGALNKSGLKTTSAKGIVKELYPEGLDDNYRTKENLIQKNIVSFYALDSVVATIHGIGIVDHDVLVPAHFTFAEGEEILMIKGSVRSHFRFYSKMLTAAGDFGSSDWAILRLPNQIDQFRDITTSLMRENDMSLMQRQAPAVMVREGSTHEMYVNMDVSHITIRDKDDNDLDFTRVIARGLRYTARTAKGDCGYPVLANNNSLDGVLCGLHVAGCNGYGMAQIITREMWTQFRDSLTPSTTMARESLDHLMPFVATTDPEEVEARKKIQNEPDLPAWGIVASGYASVPASKSKLRPSQLTDIAKDQCDYFTTARATPAFSLNDPRVDEDVRAAGVMPMSMGLNKYANPPHTFPRRAFALASVTIATVLSTLVPQGTAKRLLDFNETLNGIPGMMKAIDVHTSMGFPYVKLAAGAKGKSALLKDVNEGYRTGEQCHYVLNEDPNGPKYKGELLSTYFKRRYDEMERLIRAAVIPSYFSYETMKDELQSEKKIRGGKARIFECLPLEASLLTRKYFGVFMGTMQQNCVDHPISVGINPTSLDWTRLFTRLTKFGEHSLIAGDYVNWDGKLMADVMLEATKLINDWYGDEVENKNARLALVQSFIHTDIIVLNTIVRKRSGMPSGAPVTSPINSLCNWFYILAALVDMLEQQEFEKKTGFTLTPEYLIDNVEMAFYGDDHVVAIAGPLQRFVNFKSFVKYFKEVGITYTDSQKRDHVDFEFENIYEITYLKRRFLRDKVMPKLIRAPLSLSSVVDMVYWTKASKGASEAEVYRSRVRDFEASLAQHEQETYDKYIGIFNAAIQVVHENAPNLAQNFPKICTPYDFHTTQFLSERGVTYNA